MIWRWFLGNEKCIRTLKSSVPSSNNSQKFISRGLGPGLAWVDSEKLVSLTKIGNCCFCYVRTWAIKQTNCSRTYSCYEQVVFDLLETLTGTWTWTTHRFFHNRYFSTASRCSESMQISTNWRVKSNHTSTSKMSPMTSTQAAWRDDTDTDNTNMSEQKVVQ